MRVHCYKPSFPPHSPLGSAWILAVSPIDSGGIGLDRIIVIPVDSGHFRSIQQLRALVDREMSQTPMDKGIDFVADATQQADMHAPPRISSHCAVQFDAFLADFGNRRSIRS
jgi:hypothetical protein